MLRINKLISIAVFLFNLIVGIVLYYFPLTFDIFGVGVFILSLCGLVWIIYELNDDFLLQLRFMFLAAIGYYAAFSKILSRDMLFLDFGIYVQTFEIAVKMFALTLLAIAGSQIAYILLSRKNTKQKIINPIIDKSFGISDVKLFHITLFLIIFIGYLSSLSYGKPVWEAAYGAGEGEGQLLGNLQSMGVIILGLNFVILFRLKSKIYWIFGLSGYFYFLVWGILIRGGRLEFLSGMLTIFILQKIIFGKNRYFQLKGYLILIISAAFMEYAGYLRHALTEVNPEGMIHAYFRMLDDGIFFMGTISGIASAYANVLHMVENNVINYQLGLPYLEYILRTPPEILYPGRPPDLSSIFEEYSYTSIGGFFELAEAYLSFGVFGAFFIPGLITYSFKKIQNEAKNGNLLGFIILCSILSVFMRGAWYQTFAYYKAMVTGLIIFFVIWLVKSNINSNFKRT